MKTFLTSLFICLICCIPTTKSYAQQSINSTLRLVLFTDTDDIKIGRGAAAARKELNILFTQASQRAGINYKVYNQENSFSVFALENTLQQVREESQPNDVIVFYALCHGFRNPSQSDPFPNLFLGRNGIDAPNDEGYSLQMIHDELRDNARLCITIADACNVVVQQRDFLTSLHQENIDETADLLPTMNEARCKELLLFSKGDIIMSASSEGETSKTTSTGAYFLDSFMDEFYYMANEKIQPADWQNFVNLAKESTIAFAESRNRTQNPYAEVNVQQIRPASGTIEEVEIVDNEEENEEEEIIEPIEPIETVTTTVSVESSSSETFKTGNFIAQYNPQKCYIIQTKNGILKAGDFQVKSKGSCASSSSGCGSSKVIKTIRKKTIVIPAEYKTVKKVIKVKDARQKQTIEGHIVTIPAKYKTVETEILIRPEQTETITIEEIPTAKSSNQKMKVMAYGREVEVLGWKEMNCTTHCKK